MKTLAMQAIKVPIYMNNTLSSRLRELKNKGKVQLSNPKSGCSHLRERSLKSVQTGFHKGGRNWSWSFTRVVAKRASTVFQIKCDYYCHTNIPLRIRRD